MYKARMTHNGPAIKCVCVAERMKAGAVMPNRGNVLAPAGMSEAWRGFWRHGTNFSGVYECRGTNELSDWYLVTLQKL